MCDMQAGVCVKCATPSKLHSKATNTNRVRNEALISLSNSSVLLTSPVATVGCTREFKLLPDIVSEGWV